jgi:hypothetical protein
MILQICFGIVVQDQLIICNFGFFGTELAALLILKIVRIREKKGDVSCQESETNS